MITYSIKDLERISGIKAHTLRIWEQRYKLLKPSRTDSNIRLYSNEDLKFILNISLLNRNGYKISKLAKLDYQEINARVLKIFEQTHKEEEHIEGLVLAMLQFDEEKFHEIISHNYKFRGVEETFENIVFPFLSKTGVMWLAGSVFPAQEHFISNLIREKLIDAMHNIRKTPIVSQEKYLLFLPDEELHEISLLYYNYLIRARGNQVYYLGQAVPLEDVIKTFEVIQPTCIITIITLPLKNIGLEEYLNMIGGKCPSCFFLVSGFQVFNSFYPVSPKFQIFGSAAELKFFLDKKF